MRKPSIADRGNDSAIPIRVRQFANANHGSGLTQDTEGTSLGYAEFSNPVTVYNYSEWQWSRWRTGSALIALAAVHSDRHGAVISMNDECPMSTVRPMPIALGSLASRPGIMKSCGWRAGLLWMAELCRDPKESSAITRAPLLFVFGLPRCTLFGTTKDARLVRSKLLHSGYWPNELYGIGARDSAAFRFRHCQCFLGQSNDVFSVDRQQSQVRLACFHRFTA